MVNTKLFTLLQTFSGTDLQRFRKYLLSPFFNENEDFVRLFDRVRSNLRTMGKTKPGAQKLGYWQHLFPGQPYDDTRFRRFCSDLYKLALDYLSVKEFRSDSPVDSIYLLDALAPTKLDKHFEGVVRGVEQKQRKSGWKNAQFHFIKYMLGRQRHEHLEHRRGKTANLQFLERADYHLDCYYFSKKLEHYCDALGYKKMVSLAADIRLFPDFMTYLQEHGFLVEPSVRAYYLAAQMNLFQEEEAYFRKLKRLLETDATCFRQKELQVLFIHLMNYCIDTKINNGHTEYYRQLFSLYRTALDKEIIFEDDELNPHHYKNIITIGLQVQEFGWVEKFIQDFTPRLPKDTQENALNYNLAHLYFYKGEYSKVIGQLREVEYPSPVYALGSKLLLLRTYFELKEDMALDSLIDSFRIYLRRHRLISRDVKQQYLNVLRFTKKLAAAAPYDRPGIEKIKAQIENCKALAVKKWLLEKVDERLKN